jgi:hypothetical protein
MGAGVQRWWLDHKAECAAWDARLDGGMVRVMTEDGIEMRVRLVLTKPMVSGVVDLTDGTIRWLA